VLIKIILILFPIFYAQAEILEVSTGDKLTLEKFVTEKVTPGTVLVLGEAHAFSGEENQDQKNQVLIIKKLVETYKQVNVGMEFISYVYQNNIDNYLSSKISEDVFLNQISWGQNPFVDYRDQILEVKNGNGWAYGLNAPQELTSYVGKNSMDLIPNQLSSFLPPNFGLGNDLYKERFFNEMGFLSHHGASVENYFQAQSIWDDTMAWKVSEIMAREPSSVLVVIVGQFHMQYGGGLQDRVKIRAPHLKVVSCLQSSAYKDVSESDLKQILYSSQYGQIADYY
jgi:uncharacterized iron-regulated protein